LRKLMAAFPPPGVRGRVHLMGPCYPRYFLFLSSMHVKMIFVDRQSAPTPIDYAKGGTSVNFFRLRLVKLGILPLTTLLALPHQTNGLYAPVLSLTRRPIGGPYVGSQRAVGDGIRKPLVYYSSFPFDSRREDTMACRGFFLRFELQCRLFFVNRASLVYYPFFSPLFCFLVPKLGRPKFFPHSLGTYVGGRGIGQFSKSPDVLYLTPRTVVPGRILVRCGRSLDVGNCVIMVSLSWVHPLIFTLCLAQGGRTLFPSLSSCTVSTAGMLQFFLRCFTMKLPGQLVGTSFFTLRVTPVNPSHGRLFPLPILPVLLFSHWAEPHHFF